MQIKKVSKKQKTLWIIGNIISLILITVFFICFIVGSIIAASELAIISIVLSVLYLLFAVLLIIWPNLKYKRYVYAYDDKRLFLSRGVIFKHQITAPLCQIQDLQLFEGPIMRLFGLARVEFSTGGSNFNLSGLDKSDAAQMVQDIEEKLRKRVEVLENENIL